MKTPKRQNEFAVSLITRGGYTPAIFKVNKEKRHSKNNTVVGVELYKNGIVISRIVVL